MMMDQVKPQKAGLRMKPICSFDKWKSAPKESRISPRIEKTIDVVTRAIQLATKSFLVFMLNEVYTNEEMANRYFFDTTGGGAVDGGVGFPSMVCGSINSTRVPSGS